MYVYGMDELMEKKDIERRVYKNKWKMDKIIRRMMDKDF